MPGLNRVLHMCQCDLHDPVNAKLRDMFTFLIGTSLLRLYQASPFSVCMQLVFHVLQLQVQK